MMDALLTPVSAILWVWFKLFGAILGPDNGVTWTLSVLFLTFTVRILLFKPFVAQVRSMRKMQEFAPEIKKLQAKYKGDRQRLAKEMQKMQAEHGVNPLGGCLPILVQIPVFISLFWMLRRFQPNPDGSFPERALVFDQAGVEAFNNASLFGAKLSAYLTMNDTLLHHLDVTRPTQGVIAVPLMILGGIATHITARHSVKRQTAAAAANPQSAIMNKLMLYVFPIGLLVGGPFFPMAILLYWLANNTWTLGQQWVVYRKIDREEEQRKEEAVQQRQSLAPRPGQKPTRPPKRGQKKPGVPATHNERQVKQDGAGEQEAAQPDTVDKSDKSDKSDKPGRKAEQRPAQPGAKPGRKRPGVPRNLPAANAASSAGAAGTTSTNGSEPASGPADGGSANQRPTSGQAGARGSGGNRGRAKKGTRKRR